MLPQIKSKLGVTVLPFRTWASIQRIALFGAGLFCATSCLAWSSKQFPLFDPVHQMAIEKVVGSLVSADDLAELKRQQVVVDQDQKAVESFEHAMTGLESKDDTLEAKRPVFIALTEKFIADNLTDAIAKRKSGDLRGAMTPLGKAMHALEDATSPAHEGFQPWHDNESYYEIAQHISRERLYPNDTGPDGRRAKLEGAVRLIFDIFIGKLDMPDHFFNTDGTLRQQSVPAPK